MLHSITFAKLWTAAAFSIQAQRRARQAQIEKCTKEKDRSCLLSPAGYEPKWVLSATLMMHRRRQATAQELAESEAQMRAAQERMAAEAHDRNELPLEDRPPGTNNEIVLTEVTEVSQETGNPAIVGGNLEALENQPTGNVTAGSRNSPPLTPPPDRPPEAYVVPVPMTPEASSLLQGTVRSVDDLRTSRPGDWSAVRHSNGIPTEVRPVIEQSASRVSQSDGRREEEGSRLDPGAGSVRSAQTPLFSLEQLRHLSMIEQQAPWLYARVNASMPPVVRPDFMQTEEDRMRRRLDMESHMSHTPIQPERYQTMEQTADLFQVMEKVAEENRALRQRLQQMEAKVQEGEVKFSTPESQKEAADPQSQVPHRLPTQEAAEGVPTAEEPREAADPQSYWRHVPRLEETSAGRQGEQPTSTAQPGFQSDQTNQGQQPNGRDDFAQRSMEFMLLMMQSLRDLQRKSEEGRDEPGVIRGVEVVRTGSPDLPLLSMWEPHNGPLQIGDWLLLIEPIISDLSITAGEWWTGMVTAAEKWYRDHMAMNPLEKIQHRLEVPTVLTADKWMRLERRTASMLLQAVPAPIRDELVSSRRMSSFGILTHLLATYSPGGVSEKQTLLRNLEDPADISGIADAPNQLRRWLRWRRRATEIGAVPPDPTLQLKGLNKMTRKILDGNRELQFRISLVRSTLGVDTTPSDNNIEQLLTTSLPRLNSWLSWTRRHRLHQERIRQRSRRWMSTSQTKVKVKGRMERSSRRMRRWREGASSTLPMKGVGKEKIVSCCMKPKMTRGDVGLVDQYLTWHQPAPDPRAVVPRIRVQPRPRSWRSRGRTCRPRKVMQEVEIAVWRIFWKRPLRC